jgi:transposase
MWFNKDGHFDTSGKIEIRRCPMPSHKRRQYTEECKREAVGLVTKQGYGVTEAAWHLGIHANMLGKWKRQIAQHTNGSMGGNGPLSSEHEELLRWRTENQRLRMEREIVKQAALFFANESR